MALFQSLTESVGIRYYHWQAWSGLITCMIVEVILQMRLYALYFLDKKILTLMVVSFIISSGSTASVLFTMFKSGPASIPHNPEVSFCLPDLAIYCYAVWIPRLVFETFLCILALIRGYQFANKETGNPESVLPSGKYLMRVLIRDCIGSYLVMFAVYLTFLIIWVENVHLTGTCFTLAVGLESIVGTRTILGIRKVTESSGPEISPSIVHDFLT
ncbi:hypothetical protein DFH05DRAFT_398094 [Lentinula detonsa]|uniref:Uncharacterized protein n=1 Tax=Lentinula detonsa TaxID=2804962 RepID=A0A9W8TTV6_9AGAR|nr:hypothetical protein DFH05DRAFT_398094 [Lentinula detonsa]